MPKLLHALSLLFASLLFQAGPAEAAAQCTGLDIAFDHITLTGVYNGQLSYDVTITNPGTQTITFNKLILKNYVSTDQVFDGADVSGGNALFSSFATGSSVLPGQSATASFHANYSVNIKTIPYLILQLEYQDAECDAANNQIIACTRPDAAFKSLYIRTINADDAYFDFEIQNVGGDTLFLPNLVLQNYVSMDQLINGGDAPAGGTILSFDGKQYLLANETYASSYGAYASSIGSYNYLLTSLAYAYAECNTTDNNQVQAMAIVASNPKAAFDAESQVIAWDMVTHSFITQDNPAVAWSGAMTYKLYDVSGQLLTTGKIKAGERVYLQEGGGLGVLIVSDDQHSYSQKIVR